MVAAAGGIPSFGRVFKTFRHEGVEFSTCEFYMALSDYQQLMKLTEDMVSGMVKQLRGGYKIKYPANESLEIDFTPPFRTIQMIAELEKQAGLKLPEDLASEAANTYLVDACARLGVTCPPPMTTVQLLDKLVGKYVKDQCVQPTFIVNHSAIMSPLAKEHGSNPGLAERFELIINKHELCNGYSVLVDSLERLQRVHDLRRSGQPGPRETSVAGRGYSQALLYGMPPACAWGFEIERFSLLIAGRQGQSLTLRFIVIG
ncbi:unnamed protein product [Arabis nemorensis]|uniref:Aminoacyl-tRNA synthetase class II (D/K/N) domain-containing protein n=1 Tax=Arabis nemorensis TaxID=586526 RepID=A0A565CJQ1_9BRAS|nr:unnamed protein product [Arabis nemorensis]